MAKIKTLLESLNEGYEKAFDHLDKKVENLGEVEIKEIKDEIYVEGGSKDKNEKEYLKRIVIYKEKEDTLGVSSEWQPYIPTLDTDLMEFVETINQPNIANVALEDLYEGGFHGDKEIKTIRDLVSIKFSTFKTYCHRDKSVQRKWEGIDKTLRQYGFKLYNK